MIKPIDSHFHSQTLQENGQNLEEAWESVSGGIDIGTTFNDLVIRSRLLENQKHIKLSAAMGPWETKDTTEKELSEKFEVLLENIEIYKPSFVGETGLDNYCGYGPENIQEDLFIKHLELAEQLKQKVIIHNRQADSQMVGILKEHSPSQGGIIHCFSGDLEVMRTALDRGFYISYAGNLTYKSNQDLRDTLKYVPEDRLLLETDAPYLTPVPKRGMKNSPIYIIHTYECAAAVLGKDLESLTEKIVSNFNAFIS